MRTKQKTIRGGFTLAEILTTVAIIAILLAVLLPALNNVGKTAATVRQKAQFHGIEIALETFRSDKGDYPPSAWDDRAEFIGYTASHRLAEALVGRDGLGFHPESIYTNDGTNMVTPKAGGAKILSGLYLGLSTAINPLWQTQDENVAARKGPYMELESANAILLGDIYNLPVGVNLVNSYVLADSMKSVKNIKTGKKTGMPILYYRANRLKIGHDSTDVGPASGNTYNLYDSVGSPLLIMPSPSGKPHPLGNAANYKLFYSAIQNPNFQNPARPYRAESFILHSAGADGLYGTADDVFNFEEEK